MNSQPFIPLDLFDSAVFAVAALAGGIASVSGFGIGSLLTPLVALKISLKLAVAVVAIPHFAATALRFWLLRKKVDRAVFVTFGISSAIGGLAGALFQATATSPFLSYAFGGLLMLAGFTSLTGLSSSIKLPKHFGWFAGVLSGVFGGLVGNQGGVRTAALLAYEMDKDALVATATAVGLVVDVVRMPVYFSVSGPELWPMWPLVLLATIGTVLGTVGGKVALERIPDKVYRIVLGALILALGVYEILRHQ